MGDSANVEAFRLEEYRAINARLEYCVKDLYHSEVIFGAVILAFYAWAFKDGIEVISRQRFIFLIPVAIAIIAFFKFRFRYAYLRELESYAREIEAYVFSDGGPAGWEHRFIQPETPFVQYRIVRLTVWCLLLIGSILVSIFGAGWLPRPGL